MPAGRRAVNKKKIMPNKLPFGQRIAVVWQELVEHLHTLSNDGDDDPSQEQHEDLAAGTGADGGK